VFKAIIIDPNMLGPLPKTGDNIEQIHAWAAYELMMHRVFMAFYPFDILEKGDVEEFYELYRALQDGTNPLYAYMALRYFERGLELFIRRGVHIVFMFDEFEELLKQMPPKFFQTLRGIRDINKRQMSFLTFTRSPLSVLIQQYNIPILEIEPFSELFTDNLCYVGPYNEADGKRMVENLISRHPKQYAQPALDFIQWATGRTAGLLRAAFHLLDTMGTIDASQVQSEGHLTQLAGNLAIKTECHTIWMSLSAAEITILKSAAGLASFTQGADTQLAITSLVKKKLLVVDKLSHKLTIQPPIFRAFILTDSEIVAS
jgi:hypothetical protein